MWRLKVNFYLIATIYWMHIYMHVCRKIYTFLQFARMWGGIKIFINIFFLHKSSFLDNKISFLKNFNASKMKWIPLDSISKKLVKSLGILGIDNALTAQEQLKICCSKHLVMRNKALNVKRFLHKINVSQSSLYNVHVSQCFKKTLLICRRSICSDYSWIHNLEEKTTLLSNIPFYWMVYKLPQHIYTLTTLK